MTLALWHLPRRPQPLILEQPPPGPAALTDSQLLAGRLCTGRELAAEARPGLLRGGLLAQELCQGHGAQRVLLCGCVRRACGVLGRLVEG